MKRAVILILIFFALTPGRGQTHVRTNWLYQTTAATTVAQTFPGASGTGDLIVVHLDWANSGVTVSSVKDSKNNTYMPVPGTAITWNGGAWGAQLWYSYNVTGTTAPAKITVTATFSGAPTGTPSFSQIYIDEYSGIASSIDPLDQITAGAGFNARNTNNSNVIEDENVAAIGSYSTSFTGAATGNWVAQMASFISTNSILPVSFSSFSGECNEDGRIALSWITASENNNDYFTIQESTDGADWTNIGTVKAVGNSAVSEDYSYAAQPGSGSSFYFRIQQTDLNGNFTYSSVIAVNSCTITLTAAASVYPNPITGSSLSGRITYGANETYTIEVVNTVGRVIARSQIAQPEFRVDLPSTLPAGVYYARIASKGSSSVTPFLVN